MVGAGYRARRQFGELLGGRVPQLGRQLCGAIREHQRRLLSPAQAAMSHVTAGVMLT